ncbi:MAG: serine/threonine protein kinase, partial [Candidatus Eisenbacteria bacterium]|nr:serine/threonine protein kinase [Candidatus Eisenbacteria bacterium]
MTEHDFESIQRIFERASELAPEDRLDFLEEACGGDTKLISHVAELLRSHDDPVVIRAVEQSWPRPVEVVGSTNDSAGRRIGPYRIVRRIGVGGMGAVYLARRDDDQFDQEVALKLISIGIPGAEAWSRFRDERQILARLNHPHIARLLDGGMTSEGLLYFVMEYVDGVPIDRHCSVEHLEYRDRLRLFLDVCSAVQHAHSMLVVHRDLKPANVLVDRSGSVRLLDFGIAKSLEAEQRETLTRTGISPMTPEYASPEQARGEPVTTASDVYSLGVMLHLLLTGRLPYELRGASPAEIERIITSAEPEKPSRVVRSEGGDPALVRALESELDLVIARTLHKDPARRYATVDQLAEDIGRHLDGKPVLARGDAFSYRAAKFIGRNRLLVSAAAILALVIVAGSISTAWQARTARRQAALAEAERDRALVESRKADEVARFLTGLFEVADPTSEVPDTLQVDEILDRGAFRIESELNGQPELQAS